MKPLLRVACIWLPNWPIQRLAAARDTPEVPVPVASASENHPTASSHRPTVPPFHHWHLLIYESRANGGLKVVACSAAAAAAGARRKMPLAEAIALVEGHFQSQILTEPHDPLSARQALEELAVWCQHFSPIVSLEEAPRPESLLLDLTGIGPLFGSETALVNHIEQAVAERRLMARIAVAETIGAAWALAHFADPICNPSL